MEKSIPKQWVSLKDLWLRREELLRILTASHPVLIGTITDTLRRCGNPTCHCAEKPSHLQTLLQFKKKGRYVCRYVRHDNADALRQAVQLYHNWRDALKEFQALQIQEIRLMKVQIQKRSLSMD